MKLIYILKKKTQRGIEMKVLWMLRSLGDFPEEGLKTHLEEDKYERRQESRLPRLEGLFCDGWIRHLLCITLAERKGSVREADGLNFVVRRALSRIRDVL